MVDVAVLRLPDPERRLASVRLLADAFKRQPPPRFRRVRGAWALRLPMPDADRLEYLLELEHRDGTTEVVPDPGGPVVAGPLGPKSVLEAPAYAPPAWLEVDQPQGAGRPLDLTSRALRARVTGLLWTAPGLDDARDAPLLVVHDGPEYAEYSQLLRFLAAATALGEIPPLRAALLAPVERDEHYSASALYTRALVTELLPALPPGARIGMGASLGALAMLHAHRRYPEMVAGLILQSGSFFRRRHDLHEREFPRFERITRFVASVLRADRWECPVPVALTCGTAEENLASNRALADALEEQGYDVTLDEIRDGHNWIAWRDALHPSLPDLLRRALR